VWTQAQARLHDAGLTTGRRAYGGWDDADAAVGRALWCILAHSSPRVVVETGVARGLTTRVALEALERRGEGTLWSVDVPPLIARDLAAQTGAAVPDELRRRWKLVVGSSRRRLAGVLAQAGAVDVFVHDSMHTSRNIRFELETVWPALRTGGVAVVDDIGRNGAFAAFVATTPEARAIVARTDDGSALFGILHKGREAREGPTRRPLEDERGRVAAGHDHDPRDHSARSARTGDPRPGPADVAARAARRPRAARPDAEPRRAGDAPRPAAAGAGARAGPAAADPGETRSRPLRYCGIDRARLASPR
jgi:predicted O-methyltransferase YrrM